MPRSHPNSVRICGRLSADPDVRELPSGDTLVLLRVVVARPDGSRSDSLPVAVGPPAAGKRRAPGQATAATVRRAGRLTRGDEVVIEGWLQRRFWDAGPAGRRSRLQIVAERLTRG